MISIIIPMYNVEKVIENCVQSIRDQTFEDIQIILIDDGSTDCSLQICKQLALNDDRIEVYHIENSGSVVARKYGLEKVKGDYIGFVDADDYIEPDMFGELLKMILESDADFVHTGYVEEESGGQRVACNYKEGIVDLDSLEYKLEFIKRYILEGTRENSISPSIWSKLFKAELIKKCYRDLNDTQQYGEDFICLIRCIMEARQVVLCRKAMYHYVVKGNSLSHMNSEEYVIKEIGLWDQIIKVLEEYRCLGILKESIHYFFKKRLMNAILKDGSWKPFISQFYYMDIRKCVGKRIVIFGAGSVGQDYYAQFSKYRACSVVSWVDTNWDKIHFDYANITEVKSIAKIEFDMVIIAVNSEKTGLEMKMMLMNMGIDEKKIFWQKPGRYF